VSAVSVELVRQTVSGAVLEGELTDGVRCALRVRPASHDHVAGGQPDSGRSSGRAAVMRPPTPTWLARARIDVDGGARHRP